MSNAIKVITFDLDGVYFPSGKKNFISALGKRGVNQDEAERVFLKSSQMNQEYKRGRITDKEFWSWAIDQWKIKAQYEEIIDLLIDGYDVDTRVTDIIKDLRKNGYKTAVCSNNFPARINGLQKKFHFLSNFDVTVFSYEVGATKPDPQIFKALIEQSLVKPESILFADDNPDNLTGAKEMGITTYLYEDFENYIKRLSFSGVSI